MQGGQYQYDDQKGVQYAITQAASSQANLIFCLPSIRTLTVQISYLLVSDSPSLHERQPSQPIQGLRNFEPPWPSEVAKIPILLADIKPIAVHRTFQHV